VIRPVDALLEFLEAEQARGVSHVHLDDAAREALRELFIMSKGGKPAAPVTAAAEGAPPEIPQESPAPPVAAQAISISGSSPAEQLDSLRRQAETWGPVRQLGSLRETLVFSAGNPQARIMLIGEAPGYQEERERRPFAGPAGEKLDGILKAMGLSRDEVYISNVVKFRPSLPRQTTNNRKPTPEEMAACLPFVRAEVKIVQPECIIALGATAAEGLLGLSGTIPTMRGAWHEFEGTPVRVSFHPSHLLQTTSGNQSKRQIWEDMLAVMEKIGLPISDKQRGFFLPKA
jgi:uracil-DNA glycosylase